MDNKQKIIGTLLPVFALYSLKQKKQDQGTFETGLVFLDWLKDTHQSAWQMLPLHETQLEQRGSFKRVPSPYKSYGIGLNPKYLSSAYDNLMPTEQELDDFIKKNCGWLNDYALFCALTDFFKTDDWRTWEKGLPNRDPEVIKYWTDKLKGQINNHIHIQWRLHQSYLLLRDKAKKLGIFLIGDLPFYLTVQSPLVWANQEVFQISKNGQMRYVSGIPDTPAAHYGRQVWGHPLYNWKLTKQRGKIISFWKMRLLYQASLFDMIRFDHAKGFFNYGRIDLKNPNKDVYQKGPGKDVFEDLLLYCSQNNLKVFAEDSGEHLSKLRRVLKNKQIPGVRVFRFAFKKDNNKINKEYADIVNYPMQAVAYTTIHDTETLLGFLKILNRKQKIKLAKATKIQYCLNNKEFAVKIRDTIVKSPANLVIVPIQDWLLTENRINVPGTENPVNDKNWQFRLKVPIEKLPTDF